jgi:hypothetical protein
MIELTISYKSSWDNTTSENNLVQEITISGHEIYDLIKELDKTLIKLSTSGDNVNEREFSIREFSDLNLFSQFYDEFVFYAGQNFYFELTICEKLKSYLNSIQLEFNLGNVDFQYGEELYDLRSIDKNKPKNWKTPWRFC